MEDIIRLISCLISYDVVILEDTPASGTSSHTSQCPKAKSLGCR